MLPLTKSADQARFEVTTFASNLSFPTSMLELNDGSMLVAVNNGSSLFGSTSAQLLRFVDSNRDGSADGPPTVLASGLPGLVTSVRRLDDIVVALSAKSGQETITLLRASPTATSPLSTIGSLRFDFPSGFEHSSYAISLRRSPTSSQTLEIFFNLGAKANSLSTTERVGLQGDGININMDRVLLEADSVHRLKLTPNPQKSSLTGTVDLIARGLRNAAGMVFSANGDLYLQDNGIDGDPRDISFSADELNYIPFQQIGQVIPNFGFPNSYIDSVTGLQVNNNATSRQPLLAFLPIAGRRSEGLTELAFAPPGFGEPFRSGVFASFIGMVGKGGANNLENPIIFADLTKREYYHFIPNQLLGNPYGLTSTSNSLYISDLSSTGSLRDNTKGIVYCITPKKVFTSAAITNVTDNVGPIQGSVPNGGRTDDTTPTITGTISAPLPAGESLRVYNGTTLLGSATVNNTARTWSYTPSLTATAGTTYSITARVADAAGNLGSTSAARTFLIENAWSYNWLNASNLANTPGVLRANVKVASPRSNEPALNVNALRVDLQTPGLRLISTPRMDNWQADTRETISQTTRDFITGSRQQGIPVVAAINTAFFDLVDGTKSLPTNLLGLAVSNNTLVSPSQHNYPYFAVDSISGARIERNPSITPDLKTTTVAFAGMTNGIVLWDGIINGPNSDLNARTAIGLSSDRRYLFLTTVDRSVRSVSPSISYWGATIADMGFLLSGFGASSGLNLDGGGSTYMAWWDSGSKSAQLLNAPLIGAERTVGTNLGIAYLSPSAV